MKKVKVAALLALCLITVQASSVLAGPCVVELVKGVMIRSNGDVLYVTWEKDSPRRLAATADSQAREVMLQTLLQAASDNKYHIQAAYPKGYNCKAGDRTTPADWIYVYDPVLPGSRR